MDRYDTVCSEINFKFLDRLCDTRILFSRSLVSNIIKIKEESYAVIQPRRQTMDEFIDTYLEEKIVPMWPTGWMRKDELRSECDKR